jgi:hypothetical protein
MAVSLERLVRDQMLIREVNERIADIFARTEDVFVGEDSFTEFLCECSNGHCTATVPISLLEYKGIRSSPRLFVLLPGHESPEVERVVESHASFSLVEKTKNVGLVLSGQRDSLPPKGGS